MSLGLAARQPALAEIMDGPCDEARLFATYRHFELANRVVSGWRRLYLRRVRPLLAAADGRPTRLLDIGFGGGDIPRALARDAERAALLVDSAGFGARLVMHDDIERSRLAYAAWAVGALPFAVDSFALVDGLRSVRRSYRARELAALAPDWRVERMFPWRLLLVRQGTP